MWGRLMPTMLTPSAGSVFVCLHSRPPPAPALYWTTVSMAGHFFFSTTCWWRADRSDSPPGGKACQYIRFLSGQAGACAEAGAAAAAPRAARRVRVIDVSWLCPATILAAAAKRDRAPAPTGGPGRSQPAHG